MTPDWYTDDLEIKWRGGGSNQAEDLAGGPTDATMDDDWRRFLRVFQSLLGLQSVFLFQLKTSRDRTPETEDYCKLSSGDVFARVGVVVGGGCGGRRAGMRALHCPAPKTRKSIIWGVQIICRYATLRTIKGILTHSNFSLPRLSDALRFPDYIFPKLSKAG